MSAEPAIPMAHGCVEKHQLAGWDARERGSNRIVELECLGMTYHAVLRYEDGRVVTEGQLTEAAALRALVRQLHALGYTQLRSQLSFRGATYFGSKEPWIEYPDPERLSEQSAGLLGRLLGWLRRG